MKLLVLVLRQPAVKVLRIAPQTATCVHRGLHLQVPGATTYFGCVGKDHYADELTKVAAKDGVKVRQCMFSGSCSFVVRAGAAAVTH